MDDGRKDMSELYRSSRLDGEVGGGWKLGWHVQSKSFECMTSVPRKSYAFIQLCNCNMCDYLSRVVTYSEA